MGYGDHPHGMHLNLEALDREALESAALEVGVPLRTLLPSGYWKRKLGDDDEDGPHEKPRTGPGARKLPDLNEDFPLTHARLGKMISMVGNFALAVDKSSLTGDTPLRLIHRPAKSGITSKSEKTLTQQYESFRAGMESEETRAFYARLSVAWVVFFLFWIVRLSSRDVLWAHVDSFCFVGWDSSLF